MLTIARPLGEAQITEEPVRTRSADSLSFEGMWWWAPRRAKSILYRAERRSGCAVWGRLLPADLL